MNNNDQTIIIGAGPGGSSAAIYLARFCHPVTLIDAGEAVPGRTSMATSLQNFLGHSLRVPGREFLDRIESQRKGYGIETIQDTVTKVVQTAEGFKVETKSGQSYESAYLIVAVGLSDTMPEIEGLDPYYDTAIFHCLTCDWYDHKDQKAVVIANNDSGITTALAIDFMNRPPQLTVVPTKANPQFSAELLERAKKRSISVHTSPIKELRGKLGFLQSIVLEDGTEVEAAVLFTRLGHVRLDTFLDKGGVQPDREPDEGFIRVDCQTYESSVKNLFAVGPCNDGPDQAIIAAGEGATAAMEIHRRILSAHGI